MVLKILMLHGYTQSGALFSSKTRAMEKLVIKSLAPTGVTPQFLFPTAPIQLSASEIPGYTAPAETKDESGSDAIQSFSWYNHIEPGPAASASASASYAAFGSGMRTIAQAIRDAGGIDAVCGFSQGACVASIVAAALERERQVPEDLAAAECAWVDELRAANAGRAVRFAVVYSGFKARARHLEWCYEPRIGTPTLQFIGSLDTVVDEARSRRLVERCVDPVVVVHPGGHHVPVAKQWVAPLAEFIRRHGMEA